MADPVDRTQLGETRLSQGVEEPGTQIGPYRLLQQIGEGGFGTVFVAEQSGPVRRRVALKVIKLGMDSRQVVARFEAERQALALMEHPHIARVFDAGTTPAGRPYFVMELVNGQPITEYCDAHTLSIRDRLALFDQVCTAVQHAHGKGIIHRDLKPKNVLVATQDEKPFAKVIDFGIAKATGSHLTEKTIFTEFQQLIGTPEYMSPEQAEGSLDIDTRTDVYALGVLLYELLTGVTPFDPRALRSGGYAEIQRILRDVEPPKPSTRVSQLAATPSEVARARRADSQTLVGVLRGELDWIVMKALEKDRARRYETANGLAMDVRRYLSGEPVLAAPPSTAYRLRKFVRKHRVWGATAAAFFLVLVAGVVVSTGQAVRATRAEALATTRLADAQQQTAKAEAVNTFLQEMLSSVDPSQMKGRDVTVRQVLDEAAKKVVDGSLRDQPTTAAAVRTTLGQTYQALGLYPEAEPHLRVALELQQAAHGPDSADVAAGLANVASLLQDKGDLAGAEPLYRESLQIRRRVLGPDHQTVAEVLNDLALLLKQRGDLDGAEAMYRESLAIKRKQPGEPDTSVAMTLMNLGGVLQNKGDLEGAEPLLRQSLEIQRAQLGPDHPGVAQALSNLGSLLQARGDLAGAEPLYRESVAIRRKLLGNQHPDLAVSINNLAMLLRAKGDFAAAEPMAREALAMWRASLGDDHPNVAAGLMNVALVLQDRGDLASAEPLQRAALAIRVKLFDSENLDVARSVNAVGQLLSDKGDLAEAERLLRRADAIRRKKLPARHADVASTAVSLGLCLVREGRYADAVPLLTEGLSIREEKLAPNHWALAETRSILGEALAGQRKFEEAEALLVPAYERMKNEPAAAPLRKQAARARIVRLYTAWGKPDKAQAFR